MMIINFQVCQKRQGFPNPLYFNCGTQDSADFLDDGQGRLMLQYSADTDNSNVLRYRPTALTTFNSLFL